MTIAWLSGSSDPRRSALSPDEHRFLLAVAGDRTVVASNFPWPAAPGAYRTTSLALASARNAVQFWRARLSGDYRGWVAGRVRPLADGDGELVLVTGSQGLELLRQAWPQLGPAAGRIRVIALGPVAGGMPEGLRPWVVRSSGDLISRLGWAGDVHLVSTGGHLAYPRDPRVSDAVREVLGR